MQYYTFDNYTANIQNACTVALTWQGVNVSVYGPSDAGLNPIYSVPNVNTCNQDGYPNTGIQTRSSGAVPGKAGGQLAAVLEQNAPNPASDETRVAYQLPGTVRQAVLLVREGLTGREVMRQPVDPAHRELRLDLHALPSGMYLYTIEADGVPTRTHRLLVNRQ